VGYKQYAVYMMANGRTTVLYVGVTNSLPIRVWQHKNGTVGGFTKKYNCDRLVYYEIYGEIRDAIAREKQIKRWSRAKKDRLIEMMNPGWNDLAAAWSEPAAVSSRPSEASGGIPRGSTQPAPEERDPSPSLGMTLGTALPEARSAQPPAAVSSRPSEASGGIPCGSTQLAPEERDPSTSLGMTQNHAHRENNERGANTGAKTK
jgi:putative endonuclease